MTWSLALFLEARGPFGALAGALLRSAAGCLPPALAQTLMTLPSAYATLLVLAVAVLE